MFFSSPSSSYHPFLPFLCLSLFVSHTMESKSKNKNKKNWEKCQNETKSPQTKKLNSLCFGKVLLNMELGISVIYPVFAKWGKLFFFCHHISFAEDFSVRDNALYQLLLSVHGFWSSLNLHMSCEFKCVLFLWYQEDSFHWVTYHLFLLQSFM